MKDSQFAKIVCSPCVQLIPASQVSNRQSYIDVLLLGTGEVKGAIQGGEQRMPQPVNLSGSKLIDSTTNRSGGARGAKVHRKN